MDITLNSIVLQSVWGSQLVFAIGRAHIFILSCHVMFLDFVGARETEIVSTTPSQLGC